MCSAFLKAMVALRQSVASPVSGALFGNAHCSGVLQLLHFLLWQ